MSAPIELQPQTPPTIGNHDSVHTMECEVSPFQDIKEDENIEELLSKFSEDFMMDDFSIEEPINQALAIKTFEILCGFKWNPQNWNEVTNKVKEICRSYGNRIVTAETATANQQETPDLFTRDIEGIKRTGSLSKYIAERQQLNTSTGFNIAICDKMFADDIEYERLATLAREGATIDVADTFAVCSVPEPLRSIWSELPNTLSWHVKKLWRNNKILVVPINEEIKSHGPHISPLWWVEQDPILKPEGRFLGDLTNREAGSPLNSEEAKVHIKLRYGELNHPTIIDILKSICEEANRCGGFHKIRLWKEDISGAFTHFFYNPNQAKLLSFAFSVTHMLIFIMGMFGWSGSPYVFGVFSRALLRYMLLRIKGKCHVYCDDFIGVSPTEYALADSLICQESIEECFGKGAAAKDKRVGPCVDTDAIGWQINTIAVSIRPNYKGIKSLTRAFCTIKLGDKLSTKHYQTMASLACRYSMCLVGMRPFVRSLFLMCQGRRHLKRKPSTAASISIIMWQTVTACLLCNPDRLALDIRLVIKMESANIIHVISDAGPDALGLAIYNNQQQLLGFLSYTFPFQARDPQYQNGREYMAILMIKIMLVAMGYTNREVSCTINWTGDNRSSLAWVRKAMCTSISAQRVFMADSWISTLANIHVVNTTHKPGIEMGAIDDLSRNRFTSFDPKYSLKKFVTSSVEELFIFCDPTQNNDINVEPTLVAHQHLLALLSNIVAK